MLTSAAVAGRRRSALRQIRRRRRRQPAAAPRRRAAIRVLQVRSCRPVRSAAGCLSAMPLTARLRVRLGRESVRQDRAGRSLRPAEARCSSTSQACSAGCSPSSDAAFLIFHRFVPARMSQPCPQTSQHPICLPPPKQKKTDLRVGPVPVRRCVGSVLERRLVRNRQLLAPLCAARSQHLAAVRRSHASAEAVLVDALATRGLVSSLHCHSCIVFIVLDFFTECKSTTKNLFAKIFHEFISKMRRKVRNRLSLS